MLNFGFDVTAKPIIDYDYDNPIFIENELLPDGFESKFPRIEIVRYTVDLPHQCDFWMITQTEDKNQAIHDVEQFISEAMMALEKLKNL